MSIFNEALDDDDVAQEIATAAAYEANKLTCKQCGYVASEAKTLGTHMRFKHGVAGKSRAASLRKHKRRKAPVLRGPVISSVLDYLEANRGPHHFADLAEALGLQESQVKNAISKAKISGQPIGSDGNGNWRWTADLEVRATSRPPRTVISQELVPVPEEEVPRVNGKVHRSYSSVDMTDMDLLDDGEGGLWLATRIR